jgi:hypothetical protein
MTAANKTEAAYARLLEARRARGEIRAWFYQLLTVRLGHDCRYTADFTVILPDGVLELHEVKGTFTREDAQVKMRATAALLPFPLVLATYSKNVGWNISRVPT